MPSCLKLFWQLTRRLASRDACTAGRIKPTRTPMIAITTSTSISVNPVTLRCGHRLRQTISFSLASDADLESRINYGAESSALQLG